jgi:hypothetical protein
MCSELSWTKVELNILLFIDIILFSFFEQLLKGHTVNITAHIT